MLPNNVRQQFAAPGLQQNQFMQFLQQANLPFDNSKTIATQALYHQKQMLPSATVTEFFTGDFIAADTNVPGSNFVRPQSEHFVIWGFRILTGQGGESASETVFTPGLNADPAMQNTVMTVTNNNVVELKNYPLVEALEDLTTKDQGLISLSELILWAGQTEMKVTLNLKGNSAYPDLFYCRVEPIGIGLV